MNVQTGSQRPSISPNRQRRPSSQTSRQDEIATRPPSVWDRFRRAPEPPPVLPQVPPPPVSSFNPPKRRTTFRIQDYLDQPVEEQVISTAVDAIQVHLESHVNRFYRSRQPSLSDSGRDSVGYGVPEPTLDSRRGPGSPRPIPPSRAASYTKLSYAIQHGPHITHSAVDRRSSRAVVHQIIAEEMVKAIQPHLPDEDPTFLPSEIYRPLRCMPKMNELEEDEVFMKAMSEWRALSWYLMTHGSAKKSNSKRFETKLQDEIDLTLEDLDKDLQPYVDTPNDSERRSHLRRLLEDAAKLGKLLISQPTIYQFSWCFDVDERREVEITLAEEQGHGSNSCQPPGSPKRTRQRRPRDGTILFPALLKMTDHHGMLREKPVCVCEAQRGHMKHRLSRRRTEELP